MHPARRKMIEQLQRQAKSFQPTESLLHWLEYEYELADPELKLGIDHVLTKAHAAVERRKTTDRTKG